MFVLLVYLIPFLQIALLNDILVSTEISVEVRTIYIVYLGPYSLHLRPFELKIVV